MKLPAKAIHVCTRPVSFKGGQWLYSTERRDVIVSAMDNAYAIVRRPKCERYVCPIKELEFAP